LFIIGGDEPDRIVAQGAKLRLSGSTDLWRLIQHEPHHRLHVTRNFFRQSRRPELSGYPILFNMITEPEQNARTLENLRKILRGLPGKVVNRPEAVLRSTREQVAKLLHGVPGLIAPAAVRLLPGKANLAAVAIAKAGMSGRMILRQAGTHGGKIVGVFDAVEALVGALDPGKEHLATQFVDFRSADGLYRKYRVFFIGERMVLRHMLVSDDWNVHAKDRTRFMTARPELIAEERALFEAGAEPFEPPVQAVLDEIRKRMPLDFFGMDFGIRADGQVVLFEANATMSFFPFLTDPQFAYLLSAFEPAQLALRELFGLPAQPSSAAAPRLATG
jgi:hypothetical protein